MQLPDVFLGALFPVVWQIVEWLKGVPYIGKIKPVALSVIVSVTLTTVYYALPEAVHTYILTVAIPVGLAAVFHEGKKVGDAMQKTSNFDVAYDEAEELLPPETPTEPQ